MPRAESLILYHSRSCPFCHKVFRFMDAKGITLEMRDVSDQKNRQDLIAIGGMAQVPCLVIDGKALYESDDIILYLDKNFS